MLRAQRTGVACNLAPALMAAGAFVRYSSQGEIVDVEEFEVARAILAGDAQRAQPASSIEQSLRALHDLRASEHGGRSAHAPGPGLQGGGLAPGAICRKTKVR